MLRATYQVQQCFKGNLLNGYLVWLPNFSSNLLLLFRCPQLLHSLYPCTLTLVFRFVSVLFCVTFRSAGVATSVNMHIFSFMFVKFISGLFTVTSLFVPLDSITHYYYYYYYYHNHHNHNHHHRLLYAGYLHTHSRDKPCP